MNLLKKLFAFSIILFPLFSCLITENDFKSGSDTLSLIDAPWTEDTTFWNKTDNFSVQSMAVDSSGNIFTAGSGLNLINENSNSDGWIRQFDSNGYEDTQNWNKHIGAEDNGNDYIYSVAIDTNDNIYVCGVIQSSSDSAYAIIKKYDLTGNEDTQNWNKSLTGNYGSDIKLHIDQNNDVYFYGTLPNLVSQNSQRDIIIKKFDENGHEYTTWDKKINGNDANDSILSLVSIEENNTINIYTAGFGENIISANSGKNWWLKKYDTSGNENTMQWNKKLAITGECRQIIISGNELYFLGTGNNEADENSLTDLIIKKFTSEGSEISEWNKSVDYLNSNNTGTGFLQTDGNLVIISNQEIALNNYWKITEYNSYGYETDNSWETIFPDNGLPGNVIQGIRASNTEIYLIGQMESAAQVNWIKKYLRR